MSSYTLELRNIVDYWGKDTVKSWFSDYELSDYLTEEQLSVVNKFGLFDKDKLANIIIDTFWMREIGFETPGLFARHAKQSMKQIMSIQAQLLYSKALSYDPLINENYIETINRETSGEGEGSSEDSGNGLSINSDTPQGNINKEDILNGKYASSTSANETSASNISTSKSTETEGIVRSSKGNRGVIITSQKLVEDWRKLIISIQNNVIMEIDKLFMGIY